MSTVNIFKAMKEICSKYTVLQKGALTVALPAQHSCVHVYENNKTTVEQSPEYVYFFNKFDIRLYYVYKIVYMHVTYNQYRQQIN